MNVVSGNVTTPLILVAISDDWGPLVSQFLEHQGYAVRTATSPDEARAILQNSKLSAAILLSDWALSSSEDETLGLMAIAKDKVPTVCLITSQTWSQARERWFTELYHPPRHEYCSVPVSTDELLARLNQVMQNVELK